MNRVICHHLSPLITQNLMLYYETLVCNVLDNKLTISLGYQAEI